MNKPSLDNLGWIALVIGVYLALLGGEGGVLPIVDDAPFACDGLHVLIVYEADERDEAFSALTLAVNKWLDDNTAAWRMLEQHDQLDNVEQVWISAMAVERPGLPAIVVSNGGSGEVARLPDTPDAIKQLVSKYKP